MNSPIQVRILSATKYCLRPLVRVLLRAGINYTQFSEVARQAFFEEASGERDQRGRQPNLSRVAVRTGLSRKEVAKIRGQVSAEQIGGNRTVAASSHVGVAARVLQLWHSDRSYVYADGGPRDLQFNGDEVSFSSLVRLAGGDVPPGAVRAELISANAIVEGPPGILRATKRYFIPGDADEDMVVGLVHIVHPVLEGLARNTGQLKSDPFLQRAAYSDRLLPVAVPLFREIARARCADFLQSIDDWLSSNEMGPHEKPADPRRVSVGVFYFEGPTPAGDSEAEVGPR
jgi:hypothetical protein